MADIQHYERIIKKQKGNFVSRALCILVYVFIFSVWIVISAKIGFSAAIIPLSVFSVIIAVIITWKYTNVEYEYSFTYGTFAFSRIYSSKKRKAVFEADLKTLVSAVPYRDDPKVSSKEGIKLINAIPYCSSSNPCICLFEDTDGKKHYIIIDCDAMTLKILRFFKMSAVDRELSQLINEENDNA